MDQRQFLVVGNYFAASANNTHDVDSEIFEYKSSTSDSGGQFISFQNISTHGAFDWEYFEIDGHKFLAVANYRSTEAKTGDIYSEIFEYQPCHHDGDSSARCFVSFQNISTYSAIDWEYFEIDGRKFLAVANSISSAANSHDISSEIFEFQPSTTGGVGSYPGHFVSFQNISTHGAYGWEYFRIGGRKFLAVANYRSTEANSVDIYSNIFEWNGCTF
jgi:Zn-finger protein